MGRFGMVLTGSWLLIISIFNIDCLAGPGVTEHRGGVKEEEEDGGVRPAPGSKQPGAGGLAAVASEVALGGEAAARCNKKARSKSAAQKGTLFRSCNGSGWQQFEDEIGKHPKAIHFRARKLGLQGAD